MDWLLLDDAHPGLAPLCDLRASFELRTGSLTTLERLTFQMRCPPAALIVPQALAPLVSSRNTLPVNTLPPGDEFLAINGRCTSIEIPTEPRRDADGSIITARVDRTQAQQLQSLPPYSALHGSTVPRGNPHSALLHRPWDILTHCVKNLTGDLELPRHGLKPLRQDPGRCIVIVGDQPVLLGGGVTVHPNVVFDTTDGPILLDDRATVRSMSILVGPGYIGPGSIICNHAHIRAGTVIGPHCKVGGEINACLFQGYSNKAHSGYLGNTFVGEWVNLGADTITSNLKNTYGEVRMQNDPRGEPEPTGMRFLGSLIGDHVKTAIGTRLQTGTCIHTGAMIALSCFPPKCIPRFAFLTDDGDKTYELDKFLEVAEAVMRRREMGVSQPLRQRLADLHRDA